MSILRSFLCWAMITIVPVSLLGQRGQSPPIQSPPAQNPPVQSPPEQSPPNQDQSGESKAPTAILHTQGGVWVNGYEARDASAMFAGDLLETKTGFTANLSLEGSTILMQEESVGKLQDGLLVLDHGGVSVGTSKSFKVRVNCITVVPVLNDWTQYEVIDVNGNVKVIAHKGDVRVELSSNRDKASKPPETTSNSGSIVHEGEQGNYRESEACGAAAKPPGAGSTLSPKWIAVGAGGAGILIWVLVHGGGGKTPVSASQP